MSAQWWLYVLVTFSLSNGARSWFEENYKGRSRRVFSYPRDWDVDWIASQRLYQEDQGYQADVPSGVESPLRPRVEVGQRGVMREHQWGAALVPQGAEVRVRPSISKFYRGKFTSTTERVLPKRRGHRNHGGGVQYWERGRDEPVYRVCARCPSDRAVLARRGSDTVLMEVPPIIPCHPWSSVERVGQEVVVGPQPGTEVSEGSHKVVIRLYHRRRTIATCVIRYNVIVRQCPAPQLNPGVLASCPHGAAWGSSCRFSCAPGYRLEGDDHAECTDDLEWSSDLPACSPTTSCQAPAAPDHGYLSCRTPRHQPTPATGLLPDGSVCRYLCDGGYALPPGLQRYREVRCVAGRWDSSVDPACEETNELEDEKVLPEMNDQIEISFDGAGCPEGFCRNGGRCLMILDSPMCSCLPGYSGLLCEDREPREGAGPELSNSVT